jgi:enamine deaminase RidA (YjgF/YER057c/UK114 family)
MQVLRHANSQRMSKAVVCNGMVYLAGIVAETPCASISEETQQVLATIDTLLQEAGSGRDLLVSALLWVDDMRHYDEMNKIWDHWLPPGQAPARACVEAKLARPHARVEIMVVAALHSNQSQILQPSRGSICL